MKTSPVTCRTLEDFYHIDGHTFEKQYKEVLSGYRGWDQLSHAEEWLLFPENTGEHLAIDESSLSNGILREEPVSRICILQRNQMGQRNTLLQKE